MDVGHAAIAAVLERVLEAKRVPSLVQDAGVSLAPDVWLVVVAGVREPGIAAASLLGGIAGVGRVLG